MAQKSKYLATFILALFLIELFLYLRIGGSQEFFLVSWAASGFAASAAAACRAVRVSGFTKHNWVLLAVTFFLWASGQLMRLGTQRHATCAFGCRSGLEDLIFMSAMVPLLLMLVLPADQRDAHKYQWLDGTPIGLLVFLIFVRTFDVLPFSTSQYVAVDLTSARRLFVFVIVYFVMLLMSRLLASSKGENRIQLNLLLATFCLLLLNGVVANWWLLPIRREQATSIWFLFGSVAPTVFGVGSLLIPIGPRSGSISKGRLWERVLKRVNPPLLYLATVVLGLWVAIRFPSAGSIAVIAAVITYAVRTLLQRLEDEGKQRQLESKVRAYERFAVVDAYTGLPNRHAFYGLIQHVSGASESVVLLVIEWRLGRRPGSTDPGPLLSASVADVVLQVSESIGAHLCRTASNHFALIAPKREDSGISDQAGTTYDALLEALDRSEPDVKLSCCVAEIDHDHVSRSESILLELEKCLVERTDTTWEIQRISNLRGKIPTNKGPRIVK